MGGDGLHVKCEALMKALRWIKLWIMPNDQEVAKHVADINRTSINLSKWRKAYRSRSNEKRIQCLETFSNEEISLKDVTNILNNDVMWQRFAATTKACRRSISPPNKALRQSTVSIAVLLLLKSRQRPSAACNLTKIEYSKAKMIPGDGKSKEGTYICDQRS